MAYWKSRGLRGNTLELLINATNEKYEDNNLAIVRKIPTPIKVVDIDKASRHIKLAYFEQKSSVDYVGVVQGVPICFDAKECSVDTFSLQNVHDHQIDYMKKYEKQGGIAFLLIYYTHKDLYYYLRFAKLEEFVKRKNSGGRKSFKFDEIEKDFIISPNTSTYVHYLPMIQKDLDYRNK